MASVSPLDHHQGAKVELVARTAPPVAAAEMASEPRAGAAVSAAEPGDRAGSGPGNDAPSLEERAEAAAGGRSPKSEKGTHSAREMLPSVPKNPPPTREMTDDEVAEFRECFNVFDRRAPPPPLLRAAL